VRTQVEVGAALRAGRLLLLLLLLLLSLPPLSLPSRLLLPPLDACVHTALALGPVVVATHFADCTHPCHPFDKRKPLEPPATVDALLASALAVTPPLPRTHSFHPVVELARFAAGPEQQTLGCFVTLGAVVGVRLERDTKG
jgi:hypothetical protein